MSHSNAPAAILLVGPPGAERDRAARHLRLKGVEVIQLEDAALLPFLEAASRYPRSVVAPAGVVLLQAWEVSPVEALPLARRVREAEAERWAGDPDLCELMGAW